MANVTQLGEFDEIIDARSPGEFAEDHIPGAMSCPVLDDEQRARVGTLYKQSSPFAAKKIGGALVARNIAAHIEQCFLDREKSWRPLVYCWRGGKRSGAFTHILRQIGWDACALEGGYRSYRRFVLQGLAELPQQFRFHIVSGATGSAKSRLLAALAAQGAQVLDLEALAAHKGSVLGDLPEEQQPSQKMFESRLWAALKALNPAQPVYTEAESRRIGSCQLPDALIGTMRGSPCLRIDAGMEARVRFLLDDYAYMIADPARLRARLDLLLGLQSNETLARWRSLIDAGDWPTLVRDLLECHYDPLYHRSQGKNYREYPAALRFIMEDLSPLALQGLAKSMLEA